MEFKKKYTCVLFFFFLWCTLSCQLASWRLSIAVTVTNTLKADPTNSAKVSSHVSDDLSCFVAVLVIRLYVRSTVSRPSTSLPALLSDRLSGSDSSRSPSLVPRMTSLDGSLDMKKAGGFQNVDDNLNKCG